MNNSSVQEEMTINFLSGVLESLSQYLSSVIIKLQSRQLLGLLTNMELWLQEEAQPTVQLDSETLYMVLLQKWLMRDLRCATCFLVRLRKSW